MSLAKNYSRRRKRAAAQHAEKLTDNNAPACVDEQICETASDAEPDEMSVEALELFGSLMQFVGNENDDLPIQPETEPDTSAGFETIDDPVSFYESVSGTETEEIQIELIDPSNWFADTDDNCFETVIEKRSPELTSASIQEVTSDETSVRDADLVDSSAVGSVDGMSEPVVDRDIVQATEPVRDERRKNHREDSSHLVWLEYFDPSLQSAGNEAARTENVGAGGMRVCVKTAPSDLQRVRVSAPYRGFESYAIVRNRYPGRDGFDHLCLEFVNKEWEANADSTRVENSVDLIKPGKILFADDDPAFRKIMGKILVRAGYDVVLAEDGESAVEKAATEKPDLVITDGLMPKLHGFLVCKAIKELHPPARVIMLTAVYTSPNYRWEARNKFGADEIITKPCEIADLLRRIEKHMPSQSQYA